METTIEKKKTYTYEDYAELPEGPPYYQLIDGELVMTPSPTTFHQRVKGNLYTALRQFVEPSKKGVALDAPLDIYFSETETYQPDVIFVAADRKEIIGEQKIHGAPDLLMEVLSPSTGYYDLTHKKRIYAEHGVKEYWVVDPLDETIVVLTNKEGTFETVKQKSKEGDVTSNLLEGFAVTLTDIFTWSL